MNSVFDSDLDRFEEWRSLQGYIIITTWKVEAPQDYPSPTRGRRIDTTCHWLGLSSEKDRTLSRAPQGGHSIIWEAFRNDDLPPWVQMQVQISKTFCILQRLRRVTYVAESYVARFTSNIIGGQSCAFQRRLLSSTANSAKWFVESQVAISLCSNIKDLPTETCGRANRALRLIFTRSLTFICGHRVEKKCGFYYQTQSAGFLGRFPPPPTYRFSECYGIWAVVVVSDH